MTTAAEKKKWSEFTSGQAETLHEGAVALFQEAFGTQATRGQYQQRRGELIEKLAAWPGLDATVPRKAVASCLDWTFQAYEKYTAVREFHLRLAGRRGELLLAMGRIHMAALVEGGPLPLDVLYELDRLLVEYDAVGAKGTAPEMVFEPESELLTTMLDQVRDLRDRVLPLLRVQEQEQRQADRAERIAAHRRPDVVMEGRKCSRCHKKPARVDDLCKICAREAGILVHGKIGEA